MKHSVQLDQSKTDQHTSANVDSDTHLKEFTTPKLSSMKKSKGENEGIILGAHNNNEPQCLVRVDQDYLI